MYGQQGAPEPRDFLGKKIYSIPLPAPRAAGATAPVPRSIYLTTSSGYVAISTDSSIWKVICAAPAARPSRCAKPPGSPRRRSTSAAVAAACSAMKTSAKSCAPPSRCLKNQSDSPAGLGSMAALPKSFRDWMDFSLLPDYDQVSKYFFFSVFNGSTTADGLSFKAFAPRPPH